MLSIGLTILWVIVGTAVADPPLPTAAEFVNRGMERFRKNEIAGSIRDFDRAVAIAPQTKPYLWQLGISYYYADQFKQGQELFELHQDVNRNDVENAAWHFLCVARTKGVEVARKGLLKINVARDVRVPMREVYQLYAGQGTPAAVLSAANKAGTQQANLYAHLYLGLYYEVFEREATKREAAKQLELARHHLRQAAAAKLQRNYMHDVAKIHLLQRKWSP